MSIAVTTRSFNSCRDGANTAETVLTALHVQSAGISHLFDCPLPGDERGTEGMALVVPALTMGDGLPHDVLFVASMSNDVRGFDANTPNAETGQGQILWERRVGNPIKGTRQMDMYLINDFWGILSTPVIDLATQTLYVVAMVSPTGLIAQSNFTLHGLSLIDGSDRFTPLPLNGATYQPPDGLKPSTMGNVPRKQRCGLLFDSRAGVDTVFVANGSFNEDADTNQGWVIACDVTGLVPSIAASWTTTSRYSGGGIWQGAQGPAMDDQGFIYGMVGNGAFDGLTDFGESFYKLRYIPRTPTTPASLEIVDWFTPYTDTGRVGADPTLADTSLIPGADNDDTPGGTSNMDDPGDEDLNSGGPLFLPMALTGLAKNIIIGSGKDGIVYVVDADNMGKPTLAGMAPADMQANVYDKLLSPPTGFTYYPGGMNCAPLITSQINTTYGGFTHHQHSTPVFYKSPRFGNMLFTWGENERLRAFSLNADFSLTYLGCGAIFASPECRPPGGMPGGMITLSCDGAVEDTAVLWACVPYGDANKTITAGRLVAYGADWIDNGQIVKIWDSADWGITFMHNKFNIPACINGKVYVPSYDGRMMVFG